jgi:hypothetical protein
MFTTQRLFLLATLTLTICRCVMFTLFGRQSTGGVREPFFFLIVPGDFLMDALEKIPSAAYFACYTLLAVFWAEIVAAARGASGTSALLSTSTARVTFYAANLCFLLVLVCEWVVIATTSHSGVDPRLVSTIGNCFESAFFAMAAVAFAVYGRRLYRLLAQFPIASQGRSKKLVEVAVVSTVCTICFTLRAGLLVFASFFPILDVNPIFVISFFVLVEILPSILVLIAMRVLPSSTDTIGSRGADDAAPARQQGENQPFLG